MQFLKYVGLLRNKVQCNTCDRDITWSAEGGIPEGLCGDVEGRLLESRVRREDPLRPAPVSSRVN